jgi:hypothetical protein
LVFAFKPKYIEKEIFKSLSEENLEVEKLLNYIINKVNKFGVQYLPTDTEN